MKTQHLSLLDGIRGICAIAVVAYHFGGRVDLAYLVPKGYLAVDFFFVLSGFVIARAYAGRLKTTMTGSQFFYQRLIRVWPMLVLGTVVGAVFEAWRPNTGDMLDHLTQVIGIAVLGSAALPTLFHTTMEQTIFPINGPVWSLFLELVANLLFIPVIRATASTMVTAAIIMAGAVGLVLYTFSFDTMDVGPLLSNWTGGFPRVFYSFFVGVLLSAGRFRFPAVNPLVFPILVIGIFSVPHLPGMLNPVFDLVTVLIVFPLIIASASNTELGKTAERRCSVSGAISYPLYAFHYPVIRVVCFIINKHALGVPTRLALGMVAICALCGVSWLLFEFFDRPARRTLTKYFLTPANPVLAVGKTV